MKWKLKRPAAVARIEAFGRVSRPASQPGYLFDRAADGSSADLYLYDFIGADFFGEGLTARSIQRDLEAAAPVETLNIYINSPGGDVFEGVTIFNLLDRFDAHKVVQIDGLAASMASVVAMVGDEISIAANGMIMVHDPWACACGSAAELRKTADVLDKIRDTIAGTYATRTGLDRAKLVEMMAAETWMDAEEAAKLGFVDAVVEPASAENLAVFDLAALGFEHPPRLGGNGPEPNVPPVKMIERDIADPEAPPAPDPGRRRHPSVARAAVAVAALRASKPGSPA